ncbi:hypothetical protein QQG55_24755 [Brugia pahangi]
MSAIYFANITDEELTQFEQMSPVTGSDFSYPNPLLGTQFQRRTSPFSCFFFCKQGRINKSEPNRSLQKKS